MPSTRWPNALVNMPPILEVIRDQQEDLTADWFDMPGDGDRSPAAHDMQDSDTSGLHLVSESSVEPVADEQSHDDLIFEVGEIEHDDSAMQQQDTEIEELGPDLAPVAADVEADFDPVNVPPADELDILDFGQPLNPVHDSAGRHCLLRRSWASILAIIFRPMIRRSWPTSRRSRIRRFRKMRARMISASIFPSPICRPAGWRTPLEDDATIDFGARTAADSAKDELSLGFEEPIAAGGPTEDMQAVELPAAKKKKDKKEKKKKAEKPPADPAASGRS